MVDALRAAHRSLRPGGVLVDLRPESNRPARVLADGRVAGSIVERPVAIGDSAAADRAIATAVREGAFVPLREGRFWFRVGFADVATLDRHLAASRRFEGYAPGTRARLVRARPRRVALRRALVFRILQRR